MDCLRAGLDRLIQSLIDSLALLYVASKTCLACAATGATASEALIGISYVFSGCLQYMHMDGWDYPLRGVSGVGGVCLLWSGPLGDFQRLPVHCLALSLLDAGNSWRGPVPASRFRIEQGAHEDCRAEIITVQAGCAQNLLVQARTELVLPGICSGLTTDCSCSGKVQRAAQDSGSKES